MTQPTIGIGHAFALRLVGALLHLYPRGFREEFGPAVRDLVERELGTAARRGPLALARALVAQSFDIVGSAVGQRAFGSRRGSGGGVVGTWSAWRRDAKYGVRLLAKQRTFSAVVVITLALAIGANTVIFTFTNVLLLRPLPVRDPETLGWIFNIGPQAEGNRSRSSLADFLDFRASLRSFTALAARQLTTVTLTQQGDAQRLNAVQVTANHFDVWGLAPIAGRTLRAGEDLPGAAPVVVLAHQFWQRRFGGDRSIIGRPLVLDGVSHIVVGVLGPAIEIGNLSTYDVWTPLAVDPAGGARESRGLAIVGRLTPGVTTEQANAEVHAVATRLQQEHPRTNSGWDARVASTHDAITGANTWMVLTLLVLVVGFVLLIACANLANLMLARSTDRAREIAVRTALGAGRGAIVRQLVIESILLGLVGGAAGLGLAQGGIVLIKAYAYEEFFALLSIDRNVLAFAIVVTLITSVAFSLLPAIRTSRSDVAELLKAGSGKTSGDRGARRGRSTLVVSQVALALSLAVVAALVVRSLVQTARVDVGFDTHDLFAFSMDVPAARYADAARLPALYEKTLAELAAIPGVTAAAASSRMPVLDGDAPAPVTIEGRAVARPADQPWASTSSVSADFFATARIAMLLGRPFARSDAAGAPLVAVVNREMAKRYWGSPSDAMGRRVSLSGGESPTWATIVGVSGDTKPDDITLQPNPQIYVPVAQRPARSMAFLLRTKQSTTPLPEIRAAMRRVDDGLAIYDARTVDEAFKIEMSSNYVLTGMYLAFAAIALGLAAAGLYGVISYSVSQRTKEIGIRVALGATASDVRGLVLFHGARLLIVGTVLGVAAGALIARAIRSLLYGVSPTDPATYGLVIGVIVLVMGIATYLPARRAMRVDPIRALRAD